jgi:hypothetical protein
MHRTRRLPRALVFLATSVASAAAGERDDALRPLLEEYRVDLDDVERFHPIAIATSRLDRLDRFDEEWRARLELIDIAELPVAARIDLALLLEDLEFDAGERRELREQLARDTSYLPFRDALTGLEDRRRAGTLEAPRAIAERLTAIAKEAEELANRLGVADDSDPRAPLTAPRALVLAGRVDALRHGLDTFAWHLLDFDPEAEFWLAKPVAACRKALDDYAAKLRRDVAGKKGEPADPLVGEPIGDARLAAALRRERLPHSVDELIAIGQRELEYCDERMAEEAAALGAESVAAALEIVKADHPAPGEQDDYVLAQAREAIAFLDARDLVTIPDLCRETWRVDMMDRDAQRILPFAAYGGQRMIVNYAAADLEHAEKLMRLRDNNRAFTRIVTPHELIPGHHLQGYMGKRVKPWRRPFATPFLGEGWCLYWEFRLLELGYGRTPQERLGILFWRRHRAARIVVSLAYHAGRMEPPAMIEFLETRVGWDESAARGEVRRYLEGGYGPLYQAAYMIGGLQLLALHREVVEPRDPATPPRFTEREFHDAVLAENSIPIEWIRASLLGLEIDPRAAPAWRFND